MKKLLSYASVPTMLLVIACGGGEPGNPDPATAGDQPEVEAPDLPTVVMTVPSMSCPLCVRSIRVRLEEEGLQDVAIDLHTKLVRARFDPGRITPAEVEALVEEQGFPVEERRVVEPGSADGGGAR